MKYKKNILNIVSLLGMIVVLFLLGAKSVYVLSLLIIILYSFMELDKKTAKKNLIYVLGALVLIVFIMFIFFSDSLRDIVNRQLFFIQTRGNNIINYLLSARDTYLNAAIEGFGQNFSLRRLVVGLGPFGARSEIASYLGIEGTTLKTIEMDFFDIFFNYGIYGLVMTYGLVSKIIMKRPSNKRCNLYIISMVILLVYSILGGHVFTEAMSITFLNMCLLGFICKEDKVVS
ncbi:hypothetical protein [Terrisporobacter sp.]|uniref:hypothetical protein n=1 Tax=Terrisporobacter sp. TaxID=1965305 RepID=UPI00261AD2A4|nr:hypothetical protein [Terrisporobacter sp.]